MKTICVNCIHYVVCHFYGDNVEECNHYREEVVRCKDCIYWQDNNGGYPLKQKRNQVGSIAQYFVAKMDGEENEREGIT